MPSQSKRRQPPGAPAPRRSVEPRANLDPGAYIGRKPERVPETVPDREAPRAQTEQQREPRTPGEPAADRPAPAPEAGADQEGSPR